MKFKTVTKGEITGNIDLPIQDVFLASTDPAGLWVGMADKGSTALSIASYDKELIAQAESVLKSVNIDVKDTTPEQVIHALTAQELLVA